MDRGRVKTGRYSVGQVASVKIETLHLEGVKDDRQCKPDRGGVKWGDRQVGDGLGEGGDS